MAGKHQKEAEDTKSSFKIHQSNKKLTTPYREKKTCWKDDQILLAMKRFAVPVPHAKTVMQRK